MNRIEEALKRADETEPHTKSAPGPRREVFASAWDAADDVVQPPRPQQAPETVAAAPKFRVVKSTTLEGFDPEWRVRLAVGADADPRVGDQFRRLAAALLQAQRLQRLKSVLVTSAAPNEGKTLTSLNLALVLSESYRRRVLLIEGDLRRPVLASIAKMTVGVGGLSDMIKASDDRKVPLVQLTDRLTIAPAGTPDPDPLSGLTSGRMQRLLQEATEQYDWVIVDTPPLAAGADASLLSPQVDGALFVVRARRTMLAEVQHAIETLGHDRILGIVLNGVDRAAGPMSYAPYYGYSHSQA
jgi:capsular exopolysaccharide synthesis family protein